MLKTGHDQGGLSRLLAAKRAIIKSGAAGDSAGDLRGIELSFDADGRPSHQAACSRSVSPIRSLRRFVSARADWHASHARRNWSCNSSGGSIPKHQVKLPDPRFRHSGVALALDAVRAWNLEAFAVPSPLNAAAICAPGIRPIRPARPRTAPVRLSHSSSAAASKRSSSPRWPTRAPPWRDFC